MKIYALTGLTQGLPTISHDEQGAKGSMAKIVADPETWFDRASSLIFAMRQLEPAVAKYWGALRSQGTNMQEQLPPQDEDCLSVHLMLAGLAIENLCKGYLAARLTSEEKAILGTGQLPGCLKRHTVAELIASVGISVDDPTGVLRRIEAAIFWLGRYPTPVKSKFLCNEINSFPDVELVNQFIADLVEHVQGQER